MIVGLFIALGATFIASLLGIGLLLREMRRNRRILSARLDAHAEALRMLAELVKAELPQEPKPPQRPEFTVYKGGKTLLSLAALAGTTAAGWGGRHLRVVAGTSVATALAAAVAGILVVGSGHGSRQAGRVPVTPPTASSTPSTPPSAIPPSNSSTAVPGTRPAPGSSSIPMVPIGMRRRPPRPSPSASGPGRSSVPGPSPSVSVPVTAGGPPSSPSPSPTCALKLVLDPVRLVYVQVCV